MRLIGGVLMKINNELIVKLRKESNLTQKELAEKLFMSQQHLSRIEKGENDIDLWGFISIMQAVGRGGEDYWLLYLSTKEFEQYKQFVRLRHLMLTNDHKKAKTIIANLINKGITRKSSTISQYIQFSQLKIDYADKKISIPDAFEKSLALLSMSLKNFDKDKISTYRLTSNEIIIISFIAITLLRDKGEVQSSIAILRDLVDSRENFLLSAEESRFIYPPLAFSLSNFLGKAGSYEEAFKVCHQAIDICKEVNDFRLIPNLKYNLAFSGYYAKIYDEAALKELLLEAFYTAKAFGRHDLAKILAEDIKESLGIEIPQH